MLYCWLASMRLQRTGFKKYVRTRLLNPFRDILRGHRSRPRRRPMTVQQRNRIESIGIDQPPGTPRGNARQSPAHIIPAAHLSLFGDQHPQKRTPNIPKSDDREIEKWNRILFLLT